MKRLLLVLLFPLLTCTKDSSGVVNFEIIKNNSIWRVKTFIEGEIEYNTFKYHIFKFIDNEMPNCADWMDGDCPGYIFGGYYLISDNPGGGSRFSIILPQLCDLDKIVGEWTIILINKNTIHLKRITSNTTQELIFKPN